MSSFRLSCPCYCRFYVATAVGLIIVFIVTSVPGTTLLVYTVTMPVLLLIQKKKKKKKKAKKRLTSCFQKSARMLKSSSFTHQSTDRCLLFHVHPPPSVSSRCFWQCDKGRNLPTWCWTRRRWVVELPSSVSSREKRDGGGLGGVVDIIIHSTAFPPRSLFFFA